jgi:hypothetical protein
VTIAADPAEVLAVGEHLLAAADIAALRERGLGFEVRVEGTTVCIVIRDWPLPGGFDRETVDVLIRLPNLWPETKPDMFWVSPVLRLTRTGSPAEAADHRERYLEREWQRWSRHINDSWDGGRDDLGSFLAIIGLQLAKAVS